MFAFILLVSITPLIEATCDFKVISVPITDVQVLPEIENSFARGIPVQVGTPPQTLVALPWSELNNTWLYNYEPHCDETIIWSDTACRVRRGNFYYENASTTFTKALDIIDAGGAGTEIGMANLMSTSLGGSDRISLGSAQMTNLPIGIPISNWDRGYSILQALGMGSNSSLLNRLVDTKQISSRVWSLFWGRMWIDDPIDGSVLFGGYDQDKIIGVNHTQALDYRDGLGCSTGMKVTITDISLHFVNGDAASIFPGPLSLPVCIVPQKQLLLEAPNEVRDNFDQATSMRAIGDSFGLHWGARVYNNTKSFGGDLSIRLSSGLEIRIPNNQFLTPYVYVERNGSRLKDDSKREFLVAGLGANQTPTLGRYFFTSAYLMINHDAKTFTLWQANPSKRSTPVPVVSDNTTNACSITSGINQPSVTATESATPAQSNSTPSVGMIVGMAVGSVALLLVVGLSAFYFLRKRKKMTQIARPPKKGEGASPDGHNHTGTEGRTFEVSGDGAETRPHELDGGVYSYHHNNQYGQTP